MGDEPYGLTMKAVDDFSRADGTLLITVDCGISNIKEIAYAAELGIDTIILTITTPGRAAGSPAIINQGFRIRLSFQGSCRLRSCFKTCMGT